MIPARDPRLSSLFEHALDIAPSDRAEFLDRVCSNDPELHHELASLLEAHESSGDYFERMAEQLGLSAAPSIDVPGYRVERELAGGGMSRVFLAEEIALARHVVIKTLPRAMTANVSIDRFRREIAVIAQLQHAHIVPLLAANASGRLLYYTMPYVAGQSLRERLATGAAVPVGEAVRIWRDVLDALAHAHSHGIVHRDIKPANILLSSRNAMLTDFGIARAIEVAAAATHPTRTGPIGTPAYMAPEQAAGRPDVDHRADLYAAGLVMYEMLSGRPPFDASSARDVMLAHSTRTPEPLRRSIVPSELAGVVMQCLAKDPAGRPESADAILLRLDHFTSGPTWRRALMRHARVVVVAVAGIAVATLAVWSSHRQSPLARRLSTHAPSDSSLRLYQRGLAEQRRRTIEGAVAGMSLFRRAIAADSDFALAWAALARTAQFANIRAWTVAGQPPDSLLALAVRASRRALELDSSSAEAWTVAGKVAGTVDLEDRGAAINALNRAIALDPNYAEAWFELGLAHDEAMHPSDAERAWRRAARLSPANAQVLAFLAYHYMWYDNYAEAARWADSAVAVDPTYFLARDAAVFVALANKRADLAMRHAEAVLRTTGHEPPLPYCLLAAAAAGLGQFIDARRYALKAESLLSEPQPSKHEAIYLAIAWAAAADTARALRWASAYEPRGDLHFQLHLKRDPALRWIATMRPSLLTP